MDQLLERYYLPKLIQKEKENLNQPIPIKEIEPIINILPKEKAPGSYGLLLKSTKCLRKKLYHFFYTLFHKNRILPNLPYEASINLIQKADSNIIRKLQTNTSCKHKCKNLQQDVSKLNLKMHEKNYTPRSVGFVPDMQVGSAFKNQLK